MLHEDVESALVISLSAQPTYRCVGIPTLKQLGHELLESIGRESAHRQDVNKRPDRGRECVSSRIGCVLQLLNRHLEDGCQLAHHLALRLGLTLLPTTPSLLHDTKAGRPTALTQRQPSPRPLHEAPH